MSKKIIYITTDLNFLEATSSGGDAVQVSHLTLLTDLKYQIKILVLNVEDQSLKTPILRKTIKHFSFNGELMEVDELSLFFSSNKNLSSLQKIGRVLKNPTQYYYLFINTLNISLLTDYLIEQEFDFIWAQWFYAGLLSSFLNIEKPILYVHHDWQYKLMPFKKEKGVKTSILTYFKKKIEQEMSTKFDGVISVSSTDKSYFVNKGVNTLYLPTTYNQQATGNTPKEKPSIVHLGNLNTTANRVGLYNFLLHSWDNIKKEIPSIKLEIIGVLPRNDDKLISMLVDDKSIIVHSFVEDLKSVLFPYDIHIIPWDKNTGTRTRIPLIFSNKQCLIAMRNGVENCLEINNNNAILCSSWKDFSDKIVELYNNNELRERVGETSYEDFFKNFTHKSQRETLELFLANTL